MCHTIPLKENRVFKRLYAAKANYVCRYFVMYAKKNSLGVNRLGLTVGAKLGIAVKRNRLKRRLKEMYRVNESAVKNSFDIVIVARNRSESAVFSSMCAEFLKGIAEIGIAQSGSRQVSEQI